MLRLDKPYKEWSEVEKDDVLFKIDPSLYQPVVDQAHAQLDGNKAALVFAEKQLAIDKPLSENDFVGRLKVAQDQAAVDSAKATILGAEARLKAAQQNLDFTTVTAPISGRISRYFLTPGNLVTADQTILTTIVSMTPIYVYFDIDVLTHQRYLKALNEGKKKTPKAKPKEADQAPKTDGTEPPQFPVLMALEGEETFTWRGNIDFINNQVNQSTGTITVRGVFQNERLIEGDWLMLPGSFVRIRLPIGEAHPALLVIDRAIGSEQKRKYVYVVDADNKVQSRSVVTGPLQEDGLRVIEPYSAENNTGLKPDDWVVVGGLPQLQPGMPIQRDEMEMPTPANTDPANPRNRPQQPSGKLPKKQ
jgi:multidrug efflux system membrane fusion protein